MVCKDNTNKRFRHLFYHVHVEITHVHAEITHVHVETNHQQDAE